MSFTCATLKVQCEKLCVMQRDCIKSFVCRLYAQTGFFRLKCGTNDAYAKSKVQDVVVICTPDSDRSLEK